MPWSLRQTIEDVLASSDEADPHAIAPLVVEAIPSRHRTAVLLEWAPTAVREVVRKQRDMPLPEEDDGEPVRLDAPVSHRQVVAAEMMFTTRRYVPDVGWLFLRDMTEAHWRAYADYQRGQAKALDRSADRSDAMADTLVTEKVAKTGDLPVGVVRAVLGL